MNEMGFIILLTIPIGLIFLFAFVVGFFRWLINTLRQL